jgi:SAM-dependent methyltransferase
MSLYRDHVVPRIIDRGLGTAEADGFRRLATAGLAGTVVELGLGSGRNLAHYPAAVDRVLAIEPSGGARRLAAGRIAASPVPVEFAALDGGRVALEDGRADAVLSTWTMCSIADVGAALAEVRRLLRPGGTLHFLEHGLHPDPKVQGRQHRWTPFQKRFLGGCHLDRPIDRLVRDAGFTLDELDHHQMRDAPLFGYLYRGVASPATAS